MVCIICHYNAHSRGTAFASCWANLQKHISNITRYSRLSDIITNCSYLIVKHDNLFHFIFNFLVREDYIYIYHRNDMTSK